MSDRIFGVVGLALAAFYVWSATLVKLSFISDPLGPKAFPFIIGGVLAVAAVVVLLAPDPEPIWPGFGRLLEIAAAVAVMSAYAAALPELGFLISTVFAAAFLSWRLGATPLQALGAGFAISVGIYAVFKLILGLSLATGPLGV